MYFYHSIWCWLTMFSPPPPLPVSPTKYSPPLPWRPSNAKHYTPSPAAKILTHLWTNVICSSRCRLCHVMVSYGACGLCDVTIIIMTNWHDVSSGGLVTPCIVSGDSTWRRYERRRDAFPHAPVVTSCSHEYVISYAHLVTSWVMHPRWRHALLPQSRFLFTIIT